MTFSGLHLASAYNFLKSILDPLPTLIRMPRFELGGVGHPDTTKIDDLDSNSVAP